MKHLLVHNEPKEVMTSTAVLETPEVVTKRSAVDFSSEQYAVQEGTSAWQPVSSDIMKNSLHHCITSKAFEEKNQYPIEVAAKEAEDVQREALIMKQAQSDPLNNERDENFLVNTPLKDSMKRRIEMAVLLQSGPSPTLPHWIKDIPKCMKKWEGKE